MEIVSHRQRPDLISGLCNLAQAEKKRKTQARNFEPTGYHTLNHLIGTGKFSAPGADYQILLDGENVVCGAGMYIHSQPDVDGEQVSIIMSRMYTNPSFRGNWLGTELLKSLAKNCLTPTCMITFNRCNTLLYESLTNKRRGLVWPKPWLAFRPIGEHLINTAWQLCAVAYTEDLM